MESWLFWAHGRIELAHRERTLGRRDLVTSETIADGLGGNREPWAVLDQTNRIWVFWARRQGVGTVEYIWTLRRRVFDPVTGTWDAERQ